jgi:hypothetical protein
MPAQVDEPPRQLRINLKNSENATLVAVAFCCAASTNPQDDASCNSADNLTNAGNHKYKTGVEDVLTGSLYVSGIYVFDGNSNPRREKSPVVSL